jgi:hypothetical protein
VITACTSRNLAVALVVAGIDKADRPLDQLHDRDVAGRADLQRPNLILPVDDAPDAGLPQAADS